MRWFQGSIPAAIASAKQQTFIFVVVITGDDEQSAQLMSSWEDDTVQEAAQNCVAIKVDAKSDTCVQFSQIYPVVCIPSCFFIGENGIPLEVIAGSVSAEELTIRLDKVKQMHSLQMQGVGSELAEPEVPMEASPSVGEPTEPALAPAPTEPALAPAPTEPALGPAPTEPFSAPMELATEEPAEHAQPASTPATPKEPLTRSVDEGSSSGAAAPPGEDQSAVDRLTQQLEDRRVQKKKEEEEEQIKREMERRKVGKDMVDFKRKQEDDKNKRLMDERNREKAEEKAARDRVKAQIALDRADRAARYGKNQEDPEATRQINKNAARDRVKQQIALDRADRAVRYGKNQEELEATRQAALQAKQAEMEARKEAKVRERSTIARIQFRLPDGSSFTNQFPSESRLQEARQFAVQQVGNRYGNFALATMFPRREFTDEDLDKTLLELELAPSASVVLLPQTGRPNNTVVQSTDGGGFWALLGHILYPLLAVWRFLSGFLFASPSPPPAGPQRPNAHARPGSSAAGSEEPQRETLRKRPMENRPDGFKKDGKIHRLRTQEDSEDENNTWNGNSTQQM